MKDPTSDDRHRALLVILDGWGIHDDPAVSAIRAAHTPVMNHLVQTCPHATLITYGEDVGLPAGQMGNSEVGHLTIGSGRVVYQNLTRIDRDIREDRLRENATLRELLTQAKKNGCLHLMGLVSDGGVHSHINHLKALTTIAVAEGIKHIYIHAFLDGRDTAPTSGLGFLQELQDHINGSSAQIASVIGRYYAMDRDQRWERTALAYNLLVHGEGEIVDNPISAVAQKYKEKLTDEFMPALLSGGSETRIKEGDAVLFFNFRTDRPRQITEVLTQSKKVYSNQASTIELVMNPFTRLYYATMTSYDNEFKGLHILYKNDDLRQTLGETISAAGGTQLRIAETEKYPHVTYFFNGGREEPYQGESRIVVPSPAVATYDLQPEMSAPEVAAKLMSHMRAEAPDFIALNFANTDMVGHTGDFEAAVKAAETVDALLGTILSLAEKMDYETIIIADHGNADIMINPDGSAHTAHTTNLVPIIYKGTRAVNLRDGRLADIAATILDLMQISQPHLMTGTSLLGT